MVERARILNVRVLDIEIAMLQQLAEKTGLSVSDRALGGTLQREEST
jgi:hypothetical protein